MLGFRAMRTASLRIATPVPSALLTPHTTRPSLAAWQASALPTFTFGGAIQTRNSAKRGGGTTKNNRNSAGRRLGVKKPGSTTVNAGNIIVRQRGTSWHAGEHVRMGRDHTLYATVPGFVRFYKPQKHTTAKSPVPPMGTLPLRLPQRKVIEAHAPEAVRPHPSSAKRERRYVGVVLHRDEQLPRPAGSPRSRLFDKVDLNALEREKDLLRRGLEPLAMDPSLTADA